MIKLSIVIPCYNVEPYIQRCIQSLKSQSCKEIEFIFINDGSTDNTAEHIRKFLLEDDRVVFIDKNNEGVSKARNDALEIAKGEYVFFLDGDDFLDNNASSLMLSQIQDVDCVIFNRHNLIFENSIIVKHIDIEVGSYNVEEFVHKVKYLPIAPKLYRLGLIKDNNIKFDESLKVGEVFTFFVQVLSKSSRVLVKDAVVYNYVMRKGSATHEVNVERDREIIKTLNVLQKYYDLNKIYAASSFLRSVYSLVLEFSFIKYVKQSAYNAEIKCFLHDVVKNDFFKKCINFKAFKDMCFDEQKISAIMILISETLAYHAFRCYIKYRRILRFV